MNALALGPLRIDPPVVLAPMAGITNLAFRRLCRSYGGGLYVSEMVSARALVDGVSERADFSADEDVRSVQLHGVDPATVAEAVRIMVGDWGVAHVDLNTGCPMPKITRLGGGAALAMNVRAYAAVVGAAVRAAGDVPVTVKMRMGVDARTLTYRDAGRAAQDAGAVAVTLHARTAEQLYSGVAAWDAIADLKALLDVPVLGNGDVWVARDALRMVAATGCDGVVIGRGCLGRPWLFRDLADAFAGRAVRPAPPLGEVAATMRTHAGLLADTKGEEVAMRDLRKHARWYLTGYAVPDGTDAALRRVATLAELDAILATLDADAAMEPGADALPRGVVRGPQRVVLPEGWREGRGVATEPLGAVSGG